MMGVQARRSPPWVVAIVNQKGGVGKTTTCMSLAAVTAAGNGAALVVDVDPQSSSERWATWAGDRLPFDFTHDTDPANLAKLSAVRDYDMVFVDCPGSLEGGAVLEQVLTRSHYAVLPTEPEALALGPLFNTARFVTAAGVPYRVLLNKVDARRGAGPVESAWQAIDNAGIDRFGTFVRHYTAHGQAQLEGLVITQYRGDRNAERAQEDFRRAHVELLVDLGRLSQPVEGSGDGA